MSCSQSEKSSFHWQVFNSWKRIHFEQLTYSTKIHHLCIIPVVDILSCSRSPTFYPIMSHLNALDATTFCPFKNSFIFFPSTPWSLPIYTLVSLTVSFLPCCQQNFVCTFISPMHVPVSESPHNTLHERINTPRWAVYQVKVTKFAETRMAATFLIPT